MKTQIHLPTFLAPLLCAVPLCLGQLGPPKINCEQATFDFGSVDNSAQVKHTFVVKNEGASTLTISRVKPACGCTVANISSKALEPGQVSEISADLSLKGRTGAQTKTMTVYSNDPVKPTLILTLKGNAVSDFMMSPTSVNLGNTLEEGQIVTKEVKITSRKPIQIKSVVASNNLVLPELVTVKPGLEFLLKVSNSGTIPPGRITDNITITTDDENNPTQRLSVYGNVLDKLTVTPNPLVLNESVNGVKIDRPIYVRAGTVKAFQVLSAEWPGSKTTPVIAKSGANGFTVTFKGIEAVKALDGSEITIRTDVEDREEILIPVSIRSAAPATPTAPATPATPATPASK